LCFFIFLLLQIGCGNRAARNRNAQIVENYNKELSNSEASNVDINLETPDGVVPKFSDTQTALKKGDEYLDANQTQNAIDAYKQAIELDPDFALAHLALGLAFELKEKEDELKPQKGEISRSEQKNSVRAFKNAVQTFKKVIKENPEDDAAYFNLGRAYTKLLNDNESQRAFRQAVKLRPEDGEYQTELGAALINLARYSEAVRALDKALDIDENNFRAEDLLKKAKAGRKRVGFRTKPKVKPKAKPTTTPEEKPPTNIAN